MDDTRDAKTCLRCGSANLEPGRIQSTGRIYFRPANARFLTFSTGDVNVLANLCTDCGTIEFVGDVKKAKRITRRAEAH